MMLKSAHSTWKRTQFWSMALAVLAFVLIAFPSSAANPPLDIPHHTFHNIISHILQLPPSVVPRLSPQSPNATCPPDGQCFADVLPSNPFYAFVNRIYQQDLVTGYPCGGSGEPCDPEGRPYYRPVNNVTRQQMAKFIDNARRLPQISITDESSIALIYASNSYTPTGIGVEGHSTGLTGSGVLGSNSSSGTGVSGFSDSGIGVRGQSTSLYAVAGVSTTGTGVYGLSVGASGNWAGYFQGNVNVTGNLSKGGGSFKIDDPLDPADKYLYHSFVESPDMMDIYNGNVTTDDKGEAIVTLPAYFELLNRDFRYQLTIMGEQFAQARISSKIKDNRFTIMTDKPSVEVSWQVTGIRQDPYANAHRIPVEEDKPAEEKGKYLHPTEWGQPASSGIDYEMQQRMMQQAQQP